MGVDMVYKARGCPNLLSSRNSMEKTLSVTRMWMTHVTNPIATPWGFKNVSPMGLTNFQMYYYPHEVDTVHKARG